MIHIQLWCAVTTAENATATNESTASNNTGNMSADLANGILALMNQERAAVNESGSVPALLGPTYSVPALIGYLFHDVYDTKTDWLKHD